MAFCTRLASQFMAIAPTHDDLWFWVIAVINGRGAMLVEDYVPSALITKNPKFRHLCGVAVRPEAARAVAGGGDKRQYALAFKHFPLSQLLLAERLRRDAAY
jgi:hypothetical protein